MLKIVDNRIFMRRGDDDSFEVTLNSGDGTVTVEAGETLTLTVREEPTKESPVVLSVTSEPGSNVIEIKHEDTADAEYGEYSADIQLLMYDGKRKTVWPLFDPESATSTKQLQKNFKNFVILPEVTME